MRLCELIWGCAIGQAIHVATVLGVFEALDQDPASPEELAERVGADAWTLETILRALLAHGVLARHGEHEFALTGMGRLLLNSAPGPSRGEAGEFFETLYGALGALMHMARTGEVGFDHLYGKSFYDHLADRPTLAGPFYDSMRATAASRYAGLSSVVDFSGAGRVVDVGGGEGSVLLQLLGEHPALHGTLLDLPVVAERARRRVADADLTDRCTVIGGDFQRQVPGGGDVYILAQIVNNWRDKEALPVLVNCREAMGGGSARLLVLERLLGDEVDTRWQSLVSLGVMAQRGGRSRTERQMRKLLQSAGFRLDQIKLLPGGVTSAIIACPHG